MRPLAALAALALAACSEPPPAVPPMAGAAATVDFMRGGDWPSYNRDLAGTRFSPLVQISPTNVDELRQAWSYPLGADGGAALDGSELTPLVVDGVLYATAADRVVALRAESGAEVWRFPLEQGAPSRAWLELLAGRLRHGGAHLLHDGAHACRARRGHGAESAGVRRRR